MQYEVKLTLQAVEQIHEIVNYISCVLLEPETARHWANILRKEISSLNLMPARYPLIEEEPWRTHGIRKMNTKNFLVYYMIDDKTRTVSVTAVIYGCRNQLTALLNMPLT